MKSVKIRLSFPYKADQFLQIVNKYPYEIEAHSGRHVYDAKNALALCLLDESRPINLVVLQDDCEDLLEELAPFIVSENE